MEGKLPYFKIYKALIFSTVGNDMKTDKQINETIQSRNKPIRTWTIDL